MGQSGDGKRSIKLGWPKLKKKYLVSIINGIHVHCAEGVVYMEKKGPYH